MKKVIVCGSSGFIGTHLCQRLRDDGCYVVGYDRKMPEFGVHPANEYFVFDLRNSVDYYSSFRWQDASECYQLAAEMGGAEYIFSGENDANIMHSSALINLNVLEACRQAKIKKVFFASSACVYPSLAATREIYAQEIRSDFVSGKVLQRGTVLNVACREQDAGNPDSPYGLEKLFSEQLYLSYGKNYDMDVRVGRFHNIFGSYGTWRGGREKAPAAMMRKVAEVGPHDAIEIFGDGEQTRSFLHVSEAVEGIVRLMASDFTGPVNIGSSEMVTINDLARMIEDIAGKSNAFKHIDGPLGVRGRNSDNTLSQQKLGWKPSVGLREGLEMTWPWIKEQVDKARANS